MQKIRELFHRTNPEGSPLPGFREEMEDIGEVCLTRRRIDNSLNRDPEK